MVLILMLMVMMLMENDDTVKMILLLFEGPGREELEGADKSRALQLSRNTNSKSERRGNTIRQQNKY